MKVLVFDVETTGLPIGRNPSIFDHDKWPYIVQLSYILFDPENNKILKVADRIINIPNDVEIDPESIRLHGITRDIMNANGISIKEALKEFNIYFNQSEIVCGHNISFDKRMIFVESNRNRIQQYFTYNGEKKLEYCTMKNGIDLCKIERTKVNGDKYFKFPTLSELHNNLFNQIPKGVHNSLADVIICLRCYHKMQYDHDLVENNKKMHDLFIEMNIA
jgi:DNA polymerase III epsilon subunit-like protein